MEKFKFKYFLAANSAEGFIDFFSNCYDVNENWKTYIIKGGPGTGKSSFMKRIAEKFIAEDTKVIVCPCSSDPNSIDAVILPHIKTVIMDGTAPHVVEPKYAGICEEILNFGKFWDSKKLFETKDEILAISKENKLLHKSASNHIKAAGQLLKDNFLKVSNLVNKQKTLHFAQNICKKHIPPKNKEGKEWVRFLCGVTPEGLISFEDTAIKEVQNHIIIEDIYGVSSGIITEYIREYALKNGYEIITLKNPVLPSMLCDHIIIPELNLGILRECDYHRFDSPARRIHADRFYDTKKLRLSRYRLKFNRNTANELLSTASSILKDAKNTHDKLEEYYIKAMNFGKLAEFTDDFIVRLNLPQELQ